MTCSFLRNILEKNEQKEGLIMLSKDEFSVLTYIKKKDNYTQRELSKELNMSLGKVNKLLTELSVAGLLTDDKKISGKGIDVLEPYKVQNAIILAAGFASRCAPLSYEKPKGLFKVRGEVLIERQIEQLKERGINEIYVVVGYMKELFFYLEEKYDVHIVINNEYVTRNNLSSVYAVKEHFGNSYICYSDNYLLNNGYGEYEYDSYYAAMYSEDYTDEYIIEADKNGLIRQYYQGGVANWYQMGEMYFSRETAKKFMELLEKEYNYPSIYQMKIDDFYIRHLSELDIYIKEYPENSFQEFDTIAEIERFDNRFIQNMGENILTNICDALHCQDGEITDIKQIKQGMTNTVFSFMCKGNKYIYRHPGLGTEKIIDRTREAMAQAMAEKMGLDNTLVKNDPLKGWKLSRYVENVEFDYANLDDEKRGIAMVRKIHENPAKLGFNLDMIGRAARMQELVSEDYYDAYGQFGEIRNIIVELHHYTELDGYGTEMCHNDAYAGNILLGKNETVLIDWEYAGDNDPAADIASFIVNYDHSKEDCDRILEIYMERPLTKEEKRHYYAYIAIVGYFYFSWAIYMESTGHIIGDFTYWCYNYAKKYGKLALSMYKEDK